MNIIHLINIHLSNSGCNLMYYGVLLLSCPVILICVVYLLMRNMYTNLICVHFHYQKICPLGISDARSVPRQYVINTHPSMYWCLSLELWRNLLQISGRCRKLLAQRLSDMRAEIQVTFLDTSCTGVCCAPLCVQAFVVHLCVYRRLLCTSCVQAFFCAPHVYIQ